MATQRLSSVLSQINPLSSPLDKLYEAVSFFFTAYFSNSPLDI
jgi:hypothetical protein